MMVYTSRAQKDQEKGLESARSSQLIDFLNYRIAVRDSEFSVLLRL